MDRPRAGLDFGDRHSFPPVPDVGGALAVRADRTEQPPVRAKVKTTDLRDLEGGGGGPRIGFCDGGDTG